MLKELMKSEISGEFNSDVFCHLALGSLPPSGSFTVLLVDLPSSSSQASILVSDLS